MTPRVTYRESVTWMAPAIKLQREQVVHLNLHLIFYGSLMRNHTSTCSTSEKLLSNPIAPSGNTKLVARPLPALRQAVAFGNLQACSLETPQ